MTTPALVNLLDVLTSDLDLPNGCGWGIKSTRPDLTTRDDFQYPAKGAVKATGPFTKGAECPTALGDGLCLAKTWSGMASGGFPARTLLLLQYRLTDQLSDGPDKFRVKKAKVVKIVDGERLVRERGTGANLRGANLRGADLYGAILRGADLTGADLRGAYLTVADLTGANLRRANLRGADLYGANLRRANLRGADLYGADLYGADLHGAFGYTP